MTYTSPRFKAEYQGQVLGWFDTAAEAFAAIERAQSESAS
jgi:hypothetical protein